MTDTANLAAKIKIISDYSRLVKKIREKNASLEIEVPEGWNNIGDYEIEQTVPFQLEFLIPSINGYAAISTSGMKKWTAFWHFCRTLFGLKFQEKTTKAGI